MPHHHCQKTNLLPININKSKFETIKQPIILTKPSHMKENVKHHQSLHNTIKKAVLFYIILESKPKESKEKLS